MNLIKIKFDLSKKHIFPWALCTWLTCQLFKNGGNVCSCVCMRFADTQKAFVATWKDSLSHWCMRKSLHPCEEIWQFGRNFVSMRRILFTCEWILAFGRNCFHANKFVYMRMNLAIWEKFSFHAKNFVYMRTSINICEWIWQFRKKFISMRTHLFKCEQVCLNANEFGNLGEIYFPCEDFFYMRTSIYICEWIWNFRKIHANDFDSMILICAKRSFTCE